jgi:uncharacterized protein YraI
MAELTNSARRCFVRTQSGPKKMTFTSDQYSQLAQGYDKAAADPLVAPERKAEFARKAQWFHFLARRGKTSPRTGGAAVGPLSRGVVIEPNSSEPNKRSIAPFLTTLWLAGAVLYLVNTLLFTNAINLFGDSDVETGVTEASRPVEPLPKIATVEDDKANQQGGQQLNVETGVTEASRPVEPLPKIATVEDDKANPQRGQQLKPSADRRHAILPNQPAFEAPNPTAPPASLPEQKLDTPPPPSEPAQDVAGDQPNEVLTVTAAATIRSGPSMTAKKIGTATPGVELEVKARKTGWVQFVDPSSGNTGWIHSSLVASASEAGAKGLATQEAEIPTVETPKPKLANKWAKKKPSTPAQVRQQQRKFVDLPEDEQFLSPRRRGPGFLAKRRMLRQGLMSPGFLPPR